MTIDMNATILKDTHETSLENRRYNMSDVSNWLHPLIKARRGS